MWWRGLYLQNFAFKQRKRQRREIQFSHRTTFPQGVTIREAGSKEFHEEIKSLKLSLSFFVDKSTGEGSDLVSRLHLKSP